jgi:transcriptional regulator with XRE-family HTH domain
VPRNNPEQLLSSVGKKVVVLRKAAGLTQAQLAERMNCSVQYVSLVERGTQNLTLYKLAEIADLFDVDVKDLL